MNIWSRNTLFPLLLAFLLVGLGCGDDDTASPNQPATPEGQVSDFELPDVNPNSATKGADVSPRDYLGQVSAWYFGHAT